jgi:hypothetical protein
MSSRRAHLGLHLTALWPALLGALGVLLYGAVQGGPAPPLAGPGPVEESCIGDRLAAEAWPAREAGIDEPTGAGRPAPAER